MVVFPALQAIRIGDRNIQQSEVLRRLDQVVAPDQLLNILARIDPYATIAGPLLPDQPPTSSVLRNPLIRAAAPSIVRVLGSACGVGIEGSGWVARPGLIVTAAHVVAGETDTVVERSDSNLLLAASVVVLDPRNESPSSASPDSTPSRHRSPRHTRTSQPPSSATPKTAPSTQPQPASARRKPCAPTTPSATARSLDKSLLLQDAYGPATPAAPSSTSTATSKQPSSPPAPIQPAATPHPPQPSPQTSTTHTHQSPRKPAPPNPLAADYAPAKTNTTNGPFEDDVTSIGAARKTPAGREHGQERPPRVAWLGLTWSSWDSIESQ